MRFLFAIAHYFAFDGVGYHGSTGPDPLPRQRALAGCIGALHGLLAGPAIEADWGARRMVAATSPHPRSIISLSSANAVLVAPDRAEYCLSKTGVSMMTKLYAVRLAEKDIACFEIRPGIIRSDMTAVVKERYDKLIADGIAPTRRWGEPEDIARVAVSLASGNFHFSTGDAYHVDGGLLIHRL